MANALAPAPVNGLLDVLNRGLVAGTFGAPVDIATAALRPFGYSDPAPVGGSEWIGQKMEGAGIVSPTRRPLAELAAGFVLPAGAALKTITSAAKAAREAKQAAAAATSAQEQLAGLRQAQTNNVFVYDRADASKGYGRGIGYPQPVGTPAEKLFSNFASVKPNEDISKFREAIFNRALGDPKQFTNDTLSSTVLPFKNDLELVIDAANRGNTRVQVLKNGVPVASAGVKKGMLDTIGVSDAAKGQDIGYDLLKFLHENKIANVLEVPDRSPGFVKIQKRLVQELGGQ